MQLLNGVDTLAVICAQWGDTGKGKFVDYFAQWADIIARGTGGANAGHTIKAGKQELTVHLVPSGIVHDKDGKINIIGSGVVVEPHTLYEELALIERTGMTYNHLMISQDAKLVLPQHLVLDRVRESSAGSGKIGTTGRGIGQAYADHVNRVGLTVNDLLNPDIFVAKLRRNLEEKVRLLHGYDREVIREIMQDPLLKDGLYYSEDCFFDIDAIVSTYMDCGVRLKAHIRDTDSFLRSEVTKKKILLEGAQGNLLSVDYGTYPYVTSSDCSISGLAKGVGLPDGAVDLTLGIHKAFYITRVGAGPFPTELGGEASAEWCATANRALEDELYPEFNVNSPTDFAKGIGIRRAGNEYGATTGRIRRTGLFDVPITRYSTQFGGKKAILTKLDVLDESEEIKICIAYQYEGPSYWLDNHLLERGDILEVAIPRPEVMRYCQPVYETLEGWMEPIGHIRSFDQLPLALRKILDFVEQKSGIVVKIISVGPDRDQTIVRD